MAKNDKQIQNLVDKIADLIIEPRDIEGARRAVDSAMDRLVSLGEKSSIPDSLYNKLFSTLEHLSIGYDYLRTASKMGKSLKKLNWSKHDINR